jgi:hypothetical protein
MRTIALVVMLAACGGRSATPPPVIGGTAAPTGAPILVASHRLHPALAAVDGDALYWIETSVTDAGEDATVLRLGASDTGKPPEVIVHATGAITDLALDGDTVYFTRRPPEAAAEIRRVGAHGGRDVLVFADTGADHIAIDRDTLYWGTGGGDVVRAAKTGEGAPVKLAESVEYSYMDSFAIDATSVYFANELDDTPHRIYRVAKAGGDVTRADDAGGVGRWAVAGGWVYYTAEDAIWKTIGGAPEPKPVRVGPGEVIGAAGDRLVTLQDGHLRDRSMSTGAAGKLDLAVGEDITNVLVGPGAIWMVRDTDPDGDVASADILFYAP